MIDPQSKLVPAHNNSALRWPFAVAGILIAVICGARFFGADFHRFLEHDEYLTAQNYTLAGINRDGTRRDLRDDELGEMQSCSVQQFVLGCYCSLGRWTEPNNHIWHSFLVNGSIAACGATLESFRLPSLIAAAAFAFTAVLICRRMQWALSAPIVAILCLMHPYVLVYSQTSRGYALILFLTALSILCLIRLAEQPNSWVTSLVMALASIAILETMVNMIVDWLPAIYLMAICAPQLTCGSFLSPPYVGRFRRRMMAISLIVVAAAAVFFIDRLPYVYSSALQYGIQINSLTDGVAQIGRYGELLFPTWPWKAFACLSCVGIAIGVRDPKQRVLFVPYLAAILFSLLHFFLSARFAYDRNIGYLLPLFIFGYAALIEWGIKAVQSRSSKAGMSVVFALVSLLCILPAAHLKLEDSAFTDLAIRLEQLDQSQQEPTLVLTGEGITESVRMFLPHKWSTSSVPGNAGDALQIVVIEKQRFPFAFGNESSSHTFRLSRWPQAKMESISEYNLWTLPAVVALQPPVRSGAVPYVAAWCPAFEAVAISAAAITKEVQTMRLPIHEIHARYQAKLQIFDRLMNVIIPGEAADASTDNGNTDQEISRESKIQSLQNQFGGKLLYLVADSAAQ